MRRLIHGKHKKKAFVMKIDTTKVVAGSTDALSFQLRFRNIGLNNVIIDWGDGTTSNYVGNSTINHIYPASGVYIVKVRQYAVNSQLDILQNTPDGKKDMEVLDWGDLKLSEESFFGNSNLTLNNVVGVPVITDLYRTFSGCSSLTTINNINEWVVNLRSDYAFQNCTNFNQPLSFNTANVTNMSYMFNGCTSFNSPITLNTASVTNMSYMFKQCTNFNQSVNFNTANVTTMMEMFRQCTNFNQPLNFNTANVTNMNFMFHSAMAFNQDISAWNTASVTSMIGMFTLASAFNQDISAWNVSNVTSMIEMFFQATAFNRDISAWNFNKNVILQGFMQNKTSANYNATYYDNLLQKWATVFIGTGRTQNNKNIHMGTIKYTAAGKTYRDALIADGWSITDGGLTT